MSSPCLSCGACCASYRVSFYWGETDAHPFGTVPAELTVAIGPQRAAMRDAAQQPLRCIALCGDVGVEVSCSIYDLRSSTCREFDVDDPRCNQARRAHGLPALEMRTQPSGG